MVCLDFYDCDICSRIHSYNLTGKFAVIRQTDFDICGIVNDMAIGDDIAACIHDYSRSQTALTPFTRHAKLTDKVLAEKSFQELLVERSFRRTFSWMNNF